MAFFVFALLPLSLGAEEWSNWAVLSKRGEVVLEYRFKNGRELENKDTTRVQWRITNNSSERIWGAVKNKKYTTTDGSERKPMDEGANVAPNKSYTFGSDLVRGRVIQVSAALNISAPL